jgi:hypothetical protein
MKIKVLKLIVGGMNSEIVNFDEEFLCDESEFSFKMEDKEMEGGGNENCLFIFIREDSEYFKMSGEDFIDEEIDCKISEKYNYEMKLDEYCEEVNEKFGVEDEDKDEE